MEKTESAREKMESVMGKTEFVMEKTESVMEKTEFVCEFASIPVGIQTCYASTREFCREYLSNGDPCFHVRVTPEDIAAEQVRTDETARHEGRPTTVWPPEYLETLALYRQIAARMIDHNVLLFHGSALVLDGHAYLFTAPSGTGKSTHTRLWRESFGPRVVMINDDKPLLRFTPDAIEVYGTPWDGKHHLSANISAPLHGICLLRRSPVNHITTLTPSEAYPYLLRQSYRPTDSVHMTRVLSLLDELIRRVKVCGLECNMDPDAVRTAYTGLTGESPPERFGESPRV